ncbi:MAG: enoyl-CoA hydratase/isomerase family protein, partial [Planctomycetota bacterium]|nr:enoyl-CoA hydratase/isomerase family protein [Planctomycetota bacterium]
MTLNRPSARNSVSAALLEAMNEALARLAADESVRVMILTGAGGTFCAGADLQEVCSDRATIETLLTRLAHSMRAIRSLPFATIAAAGGAAIGGGLGLMCAADIAMTHAEARMGYPPPESGLSPAVLAPYLASRVGPGRARSMLFKGGTISGRTALEMGLVDELVDEANLQAAARALAADLAGANREATARMKRFLNRLDVMFDERLAKIATEVSIEAVASEETQRRLRRRRSGP